MLISSIVDSFSTEIDILESGHNQETALWNGRSVVRLNSEANSVSLLSKKIATWQGIRNITPVCNAKIDTEVHPIAGGGNIGAGGSVTVSDEQGSVTLKGGAVVNPDSGASGWKAGANIDINTSENTDVFIQGSTGTGGSEVKFGFEWNF